MAGDSGNERRAFLGAPPSRAVVPTDAGLNRFEWDMRYPDASLPPQGTNLFAASVRGPQVVPGTYQVRLTVGGHTLAQMFEIQKDPRTSTTPEEFEKQFALLTQIHQRVTETHDAIADIIAVLAYPAKLNNLIVALAPVVAATDTAPTAQSYQVFTDLSARLDRQLAKLDEIMDREVTAFNKAIDEQRVSAIPKRIRKRSP